MDSLEMEFRAILSNYGHEVLLVHFDKQKPRCIYCGNKATGTFRDDCPYCFGTGYMYHTITRETTREQDSNISSSLSGISEIQKFGELADPGRFHFFNKEVIVEEHDLILDIEWEDDQPNDTNNEIYEVSHIDIKRFLKGQITFKKVYSTAQPINKTIIQRNIINAYRRKQA